ncbi:MAG: hypothetical protein IKD99_07175 [Erysipelotrichaceae bacterium]|nr:hypothetical protein [Erysipelotrichaceae bacterium]
MKAEKQSKRIYALLTATIDPSVYNNVNTVITNAEERLNQYEESFQRYIKESVFTDIIVAENSGYPFNANFYIELAKKHGKRFEYINCPRYIEETIKYGKSYGESKLITDALEKSKVLHDASTIYKLTGRVFLKNSHAIVKTMEKHQNEFLIMDKFRWCYTHVFKFNKKDYYLVFRDADKRIMDTKVNIERNYYNLIIENFDKLDIGCFNVWPYVIGRHGTTGASYTNSFKGRIYHDILCKLNAYTHGSNLGHILKM